MLPRCGPGIAVGDVNNMATKIFTAGGNGIFLQIKKFAKQLKKDTTYEDMGVLL
jgi:hypothetical protein